MKRLAIIAAACFMLLCSFSPAAAEVYTDDEIMSALHQAVAERGEFYTWSFEEKADSYNHYVYHDQGSRRGVPGGEFPIVPAWMQPLSPRRPGSAFRPIWRRNASMTICPNT